MGTFRAAIQGKMSRLRLPAFAVAIALVLLSSPSRAADVPFIFENGYQHLTAKGVARLDGEQLTATATLMGQPIQLVGRIKGDVLELEVSGRLNGNQTLGTCTGNTRIKPITGKITVDVPYQCANNWIGKLTLDFSSVHSGDSADSAPSPSNPPQAVTTPASVSPTPPSEQQATATDVPILAGVKDLDFGRYEALIIGNNEYQYGLQSLKTAVADAQSVAQALRTYYGFKVTVLLNASRAQILEALTRLRLRLTWDDNLLIYYAGHGAYDQAGDQGYWLPVDAQPQNPTNWVSNSDITTLLKAIPAKHIIVVADSCYSGSLSRDAGVDVRDAAYYSRIVGKKARTVMTSGGLEPVDDSGGDGHSVFAQAFISALANNTGVMDAEALFEKVRRPVILSAQQTPEYSNLRLAGHDGGDFVFVRKQ